MILPSSLCPSYSALPTPSGPIGPIPATPCPRRTWPPSEQPALPLCSSFFLLRSALRRTTRGLRSRAGPKQIKYSKNLRKHFAELIPNRFCSSSLRGFSSQPAWESMMMGHAFGFIVANSTLHCKRRYECGGEGDRADNSCGSCRGRALEHVAESAAVVALLTAAATSVFT